MKSTLIRLLVAGLLAIPSSKLYGQTKETETQTVETQKDSNVALTAEAQTAAEGMQSQFAVDSEAMAMLNTILSGSGMGPDDGWFKMAKPQSKYTWDWLVKQYDADGDQMISENEFSGSPTDFAALDRNGDRIWTADDWNWANTRGSDTFRSLANRFDADDSGEVTSQELSEFLENLKSNEGSLSLEQLRRAIEPPPRKSRSEKDGPTPSHLVMGLKKQEIGSHQSGPNVGDVAPDFQLTDLQGIHHSLSDSIKSKPTVLIFGNFTCGPFRSQAGNVRQLIHRYRDRVNFMMIYVREAHPADGWNMKRNESLGIEIPQPQSFDQRKQIAERCSIHFDAGVPLLVDSIEDPVGTVYSGMPSRLYLLDQKQTVIYKSGRGPHYFLPSDLENSLVVFLNDQAQPESTVPND